MRICRADGSEIRNQRYTKWLIHPEGFNVDRLDVNEFDQGDGTIIAKIPRIEHRIYTRRPHEGSNEQCVDLVIGRSYDPETKQSRNRKVTIGTVIGYLPGMMIANGNYHVYFDRKGNLYNDPMREEEEERARQAEEKRKQREEKQRQREEAPQKQRRGERSAQAEQAPLTREGETAAEEKDEEEMREELKKWEADLKQQQARLNEERKEVRQLKEQLLDSQKELDNIFMVRQIQNAQAQKDHIDLLNGMLDGYINLIEKQAGKKPAMPMSLTEIRTINELLSEIRTLFKGCETEDYLKLAEEPDPPNTDRKGSQPGHNLRPDGNDSPGISLYHPSLPSR